MSYLIQDCAGTVHVMNTGSGGGGRGLFQIRPAIPVVDGAVVLLDSAPIKFEEIAQPIVTLDDTRFVYSFGSSWTVSAISGRLLLGKMGNGGAMTQKLIEWYTQNRISALKGSISVSAGKLPIKAFVTGLVIGETDPQFHIQNFTISTLVDMQVKKTS